MNDSPQEMACLDRAELWEGLIGWCEVMEREEIEAKVGRSDADPVLQEASEDPQSGTPALSSPKKQPKRLPAWWKNASRAVQKDWLRDHEGRQ